MMKTFVEKRESDIDKTRRNFSVRNMIFASLRHSTNVIRQRDDTEHNTDKRKK